MPKPNKVERMIRPLTENAKIVLEKRYLLRDQNGTICENPEQLFRRVARHIAQGDARFGKNEGDIQALEDRFFEVLSGLTFLPNTPTLINAGKPNGQLSACFVLPVDDSLEGIFDTLKHAALIHQSGGGTGFSFSRLRSRGQVLAYTSGVTSGPVSFMEVYNAATEAIKQGGTRRGANMGILKVDHPDIEEFICVKNDLTRLTNFNISVAITNAFMEKVIAGHRGENDTFELVDPTSKQVLRTVSALALMDKIIESAWKTGEPGLFFIDRANADNVTPEIAQFESTNPCGEVPLLPYEACNLGSINMGLMLAQRSDGTWEIDWPQFEETIRLAIHFLDNVITQNTFPIHQIREMVEGNRKIGLGLMGWADALFKLGIPYNSEEAITLAHQVMEFMDYISKAQSVELAKTRGAFPFFDRSVYKRGNWLSQKYRGHSAGIISDGQWQALDEAIATHGIRNATTISLAPTGTISIIAGASGGIEPLFALAFTRNVLDNTRLIETHPYFEAVLKDRRLFTPELMEQVAASGSIAPMSQLPEDIRRIFVTSHDVEPRWHIRMQAAFQKHSDNAVSKTINFPESATKDDIGKAYLMAYELGLKGITVYRDNCRKLQPMSIGKIQSDAPEMIDARHCPDCLQPLQLIEGCLQCPDCQYAFCG